jgi:lipid-A-disaccharide synthase-like uncharacterized protein
MNLPLSFPTLILASQFLGFEVNPLEINTWKIIGLSGSAVFGIRFIIQGIASEKAKKSVIPFGFWECSLLGCLLSLSYFAIYRKDSVGIIQNLLPLPIYIRNLYFRYRDGARSNTPPPSEENRQGKCVK